MHSFVKSTHALDMLSTPDSKNEVISYIVDSGYDSEDFTKILGLSKSVGLIFRLCSSDPNQIKNINFIVHVDDFIRGNLKNFSKL